MDSVSSIVREMFKETFKDKFYSVGTGICASCQPDSDPYIEIEMYFQNARNAQIKLVKPPKKVLF